MFSLLTIISLSLHSPAFYCHQTFQIMYISMISTFGAATVVVVLRPKFRTPQFRWVRSGLFLAMGLSGLFPVVHGIILYGFAMAQRAIALNYMFCMGAAYVFGALIYGSRVPECWFPGKFDNFVSLLVDALSDEGLCKRGMCSVSCAAADLSFMFLLHPSRRHRTRSSICVC